MGVEFQGDEGKWVRIGLLQFQPSYAGVYRNIYARNASGRGRQKDDVNEKGVDKIEEDRSWDQHQEDYALGRECQASVLQMREQVLSK